MNTITQVVIAVGVIAAVNVFMLVSLERCDSVIDSASLSMSRRIKEANDHLTTGLTAPLRDRIVTVHSVAAAALSECVAHMHRHGSGSGTKLIVETVNDGGSCYGPCFSMAHVGPETGCGYSCDFKKVDLENSIEAAKADMMWRFFDTAWYWAKRMDYRRHPKQLLVMYQGESAANYPMLTDPQYTRLYNYSFGLNLNCTFTQAGDNLGALMAIVRLTGPDPPVNYTEKLKRPWAAAWISNCMSGPRQDYMRIAMQQNLTIASYGGCLHNAKPWISQSECAEQCPKWTGNKTIAWKNRQKLFISAHHLFSWAAENSDCDGYHTEKIFQALAAGTVPIYFGGRTIKTVIPEHSAIIARDFPSIEALIAHVKDVATNEALYNSYLAWRRRPYDKHIMDLYTNNVDPKMAPQRHCKICRYAHEAPPATVPPDKSCSFKTW